MPKHIRSKALFEFLQVRNLLDGSSEAVLEAKREYFRQYRRNWKKRQNPFKKELRPVFSQKEFQEIRLKAYELGLSPTGYVKQLVRKFTLSKPVIPEMSTLLSILQKISMAATSSKYQLLLLEAEKELLQYINRYR